MFLYNKTMYTPKNVALNRLVQLYIKSNLRLALQAYYTFWTVQNSVQ